MSDTGPAFEGMTNDVTTKSDDNVSRRAAESSDASALRGLPFELPSIPSDLIVIATDSGRVIAAYRVERTRTSIHVPYLVVGYEDRRKGVASQILRELIDEAIRGAMPLSIDVPPSRPATKLCHTLGFSPVPSKKQGVMRFVFTL